MTETLIFDVRTEVQLYEIYRQIAAREIPCGSFLTTFAEAYVRSDFENREVLRPAALLFVRKYDLKAKVIQ